MSEINEVLGVQQWMALDLDMALGHHEHPAPNANGGRPSWAEWWSELLVEVRTLREANETLSLQLRALDVDVEKARHIRSALRKVRARVGREDDGTAPPRSLSLGDDIMRLIDGVEGIVARFAYACPHCGAGDGGYKLTAPTLDGRTLYLCLTCKRVALATAWVTDAKDA